MKTAEQVLINVYGCKDIEDLKKCFSQVDVSLKMIIEAMEQYSQQFQSSEISDEEILAWAKKDSADKIQQCHNIYKKVKGAWTPDKRSFEKAELEAGNHVTMHDLKVADKEINE